VVTTASTVSDTWFLQHRIADKPPDQLLDYKAVENRVCDYWLWYTVIMTTPEGLRWIQAATEDLNAAESLFQDGYYHLCAFHAQQAAEKALKGVLRLLGRIPWGHSCLSLLTEALGMVPPAATSAELLEAAQRLDGHYISARYPDAYPSGTPADYYDESAALQAKDDAATILMFVHNHLP
jgi:HEPN domain-containing protein